VNELDQAPVSSLASNSLLRDRGHGSTRLDGKVAEDVTGRLADSNRRAFHLGLKLALSSKLEKLEVLRYTILFNDRRHA
jgi:hypothetical protein